MITLTQVFYYIQVTFCILETVKKTIMDYRINKVGEGWEFLPDKEKKEKLDYERLFNNIVRREKKIDSELGKIKKLKEELKEMKKNRTIQHHQLIKYHKEFSPSFSTSLSKNKKKKETNNNKGLFMTSGNKSWTITVRVGGKNKPIYLGTQHKVNEMLDKIEGRSDYWINYYPHQRPEHEKTLLNMIEKLVYPLIKRDMLECLNGEGSLDSYLNRTIKGQEYLDELYLNSGFFEERTPVNPLVKSKFITYNGGFIKSKKK